MVMIILLINDDDYQMAVTMIIAAVGDCDGSGR